MANKTPNDATSSNSADVVNAAVSALALDVCKNSSSIIAQSESWVLLKHLPAAGWNLGKQVPSVLVGRTMFDAGVLEKKATLIASSRLPKNLQSHASWFDAIRTIATRLDEDSQTLLTASGTAADPYVRRIGALFGIELIDAEAISIKQLTTRKHSNSSANKIFFLEDHTTDSIDAVLIHLAHTVHVLSVRRGGNIHRGIIGRLGLDDARTVRPTQVRLLNDAPLTKPKLKEDLLDLGVIDWLLLPAADDNEVVGSAAPPLRTNSVVPLESFDQSQFLLHWARHQSDAWPDQNSDAHLDQLIFGSTEKRHQEVMTLCRIIASNRLIGGADLTRDPAPVVCFSGVSVGELPQRTIFRKHLARWDFVPYGLAVRKSVLQAAGCKEVIYGDDAAWEKLSIEDRPWFQLQTSKNGKIDWTKEKEWRLIGDLDLSKIADGDAFAFVKTPSDAARLSEICRWPIVVLGAVVDD